MTSLSRIQTDSWDPPAASSISRRMQPTSDAIRDAWEDDDDDGDELGEVEDSQRVWEEANKRARMPELMIAGSSTSGPPVASPPPAVFQPALKILKRPTINPSSSSSSSLSSSSINTSTNSYAEREARYQAARDRIFGDSDTFSDIPQDLPPLKTLVPKAGPPPVQISREPRGPPVSKAGSRLPNGKSQDGDIRGFGGRRGKRREAIGATAPWSTVE